MITNFYKVRIELLSFPNKVLQRSKFITKVSVKKFWSLFSPKTVLKLSKLSTNSKYLQNISLSGVFETEFHKYRY